MLAHLSADPSEPYDTDTGQLPVNKPQLGYRRHGSTMIDC